MGESVPRRATREGTVRGWGAWVRLLAGLASSLVALVALPAVVARMLGGGSPWPLPKIAPFTLLFLVPVLVAVLVALLARRWVALGLGVLVLLPLLVWEGPAAIPSGRAAATGPGQGLTVMVLNTKVGGADPAATLSAVRRNGVDVLVLAESEATFVGALRRAGLGTDLPYSQPTGDTSSVQIWSRWPLTALPALAGTVDPAPRAVVASPLGSVTLTAMHVIDPAGGRIGVWSGDMERAAQAVRATAGPQIVAGDFNATPDHQAFRALLGVGLTDATSAAGLGHGWPAFTWPDNRRFLPPLVSIDHVLVTGEIGVQRVATVPIPGSDHRALLAWLAG